MWLNLCTSRAKQTTGPWLLPFLSAAGSLRTASSRSDLHTADDEYEFGKMVASFSQHVVAT